MAAARFENAAYPVESTATRGMMGLAQVTPATPIPLFVAAASAPATAVPCPIVSAVSLLLETKFQPAISRGARSGCVPSTPESIIAIGVPEPVVMFQALGAWILARCHSEL